MKNFSSQIIGLLITVIIIIGIIVIINKPKKQESDLSDHINRIESKLDSLSNSKDSIRTIIVTIDKEIIKNEKHYEEVVNNIISQPDSVNFVWAKLYIEKFIDERTR